MPRISQLPDANLPLSGSELVPVVQGGATKHTPAYAIATRGVRDFGAKGDGVTDDTAAFNAALAAGDVYFPPGTYIFNSQPNAITVARTIRGASPTATVLVLNYADGDFLRIGDGGGHVPANAQIKDLQIRAGIDRSSGAAIRAFPCHECAVRNIVISPGNGVAWRHYNGIQIDGDNGTAQFGFFVEGFDIGWCHGFAIGMRSYPLDAWISQGIIANCTGAGIDIDSCSGVYLERLDIIFCGNAVKVSTPDVSHNANAIFATNVFGDTAVSHSWEFSGSDGQISDIHLTNCWGSGSQLASGFMFNNPKINGITMANCHAHANYNHGIQIQQGKNIAINGGQIGENAVGQVGVANEIVVAANVSDVVIANNIIGTVGFFGVNAVPLKAAAGIQIATGSGDRIIVTGNKIDISGYSLAPGICHATGSSIVIRDNIGWRTTFSGYQKIPAGSQSVTFEHRLLADDPARIQFSVTPAVDYVGCGINRFWATEPTTGIGGSVTIHADAVATLDCWFAFRIAAYE